MDKLIAIGETVIFVVKWLGMVVESFLGWFGIPTSAVAILVAVLLIIRILLRKR